MPPFSRLICFESQQHGKAKYFADLGVNEASVIPEPGTSIEAYSSFDDLLAGKDKVTAIVGKLLAPLPRTDLPIYSVGLNYRSHAKEAKLNIPANPPLWTKPAAALAAPEEDIPMSRYCASNFPDWEGELVFVTSKECRDVSPKEAESYILGYTIGNDLSCRVFQLPAQNGGQFFYAKAFDKFAPIGPVLVSPEIFQQSQEVKIVTKVNGEVMQDADVKKDMVFSPAQVLSFMSQSTTIPAFTAVMTGTPAGVGAFKAPRRFLSHADVVDIQITGIGVLRNRILFPEGKQAAL
ncbi:uncharacterized protein Z520_00038 [Fonsecaea multimorphosa CBS 102226]|uniref:Fumarylacetoacetase-like C-terminal domain-containing protein n=1 Tax=Fonsecaea multimorphosa CBS 102226 TaxID=1442371 RepID=A0A0D2J1U6_9EURO|nr:uncharacterized protein Z520_00038 [Fonsecaea multimorphosa CBS 102226]KIY03347.1 hypothetical protein Z520_00038 [Fonsecaea multimorphosa CBS 102226]OAL32998.1 hypothetical protein AYO22_00083 [Fonsecaea multimorphosa]